MVTDGCFTSCKMFQSFYEETQKPTKSKISFCEVLQLPKSFHLLHPNARSPHGSKLHFFFSPVDLVGRPATDHGNAMEFLLRRLRRRDHRDDEFDHRDLGDAFGDLRCPDLKRRHFTDRWRKLWKRMEKHPPKKHHPSSSFEDGRLEWTIFCSNFARWKSSLQTCFSGGD